jgi:hypothetical protein
MTPGIVISLRVNPRDCMSVADLVQKLNAYMPGMSFSSAVSIALSSAMESFRVNAILPDRSGFEYEQVMAPFKIKKRDARKLAIASTIRMTGELYRVRPLVPQTSEAKVAQERRKLRYDELKFKYENNKENWCMDDTEEYVPLAKEFEEPQP